MMSRKTLDLWVGVFVAIGFGALLFLALKVANLSSITGANSYQINAKFDNIGGLKVRAPVKSAGVVVGRVREIHFDNQTFEAVVTMSIESRFEFPKDTSAKILTSGAGRAGHRPRCGRRRQLKNGDVKITQSAVVLEISSPIPSWRLKAATRRPVTANGKGGGRNNHDGYARDQEVLCRGPVGRAVVGLRHDRW
jgi:phospholipid/cholesterol/gamma-HCH transport system substrate-binding protein